MSFKPDNVPLQESYVSCPNPSPGPGKFEYTTLEVQQREMPKDHFIWSLFCLLYSNICCLGLFALIHSVKARDRKVLGDIEGARSHGSTARTLNIISTVLVCLFIILFIIIMAVMMDQVNRLVQSMMDRSRDDNPFYRG